MLVAVALLATGDCAFVFVYLSFCSSFVFVVVTYCSLKSNAAMEEALHHLATIDCAATLLEASGRCGNTSWIKNSTQIL